jgi:hypothetical protein
MVLHLQAVGTSHKHGAAEQEAQQFTACRHSPESPKKKPDNDE